MQNFLFWFEHVEDFMLVNSRANLILSCVSMSLLEITDLHNGMILSTLSISSRDFALSFLKRPHANGDSRTLGFEGGGLWCPTFPSVETFS